ncbi:uncharacterized protein [Hetaerina americana]|uniref:uncharacterized protein n=1 Tax=Hetaerina americana TaxID=62018 RepID=UPI003A7F1C01
MSKYRALIVGAGVSGIATASRLIECGFKDFIILEAENRVGGRLYTCDFGERVVDMGAQWVHGEKNNVVYQLAKPHKLLEESSSYYPDTQFVTSSGDIVDNDFTDQVMTLIAQINEAAPNGLIGFDGSLGEYFTKEFENKLNDEINKEMDKKFARSFLEWYHKFENGIDASDSWFDTSGKGHLEYWECEGNPLLNWKNGGYSTVIDLLIKKFPDPLNELPVLSKIQCNKEVTSIQWDGFSDPERINRVSVICADGSEYIADHVIITVSLGVLKDNLNMFHPELPGKNINAIKGLAFGTVDKIYLRYTHRWWPQDCAGFSLVWKEDDHRAFNEQLSKNGVEGKTWLADIFGFYSVDNHPHVLCGWIVGPSARAMEQVSDESLKESCNFLLNYFLGRHFDIPQCEELKRSTWFANKHFKGSYSYRSMDTEKMGTSAEHLSCPLTNEKGTMVVQFAGEATHPHYFSTVHGAIEAGWREADLLLKAIRPLKSKKLKFLLTLNGQQKGDVAAVSLAVWTLVCGPSIEASLYEINSVPKYKYQNSSPENTGILTVSKEWRKCDVIIVGAGVAGLAAAKTLLNGGIRDIIILEAQDYAGGRIKSLGFGDSFIELGAQWIHGEDNEICKLAQEYGLTSNVISMEGEGVYLREDGSRVNANLIKEVKGIVDDILEECESFAKSHITLYGIPSSVGQHLKNKFNNYLNLCRQSGESEEIISIKEELYDWHLRFQIIDNSCLRLENLSAKAWGNYAFCDGSEHVNFHSGYSTLIEKLVSDLPPGVLHLNSPVKEVKWQPVKAFEAENSLNCSSQTEVTSLSEVEVELSPVSITCEDGRQFVAQHAIVTCSLGYLKENHQKMFIPQLPKQIQAAIEDMGYATINKIFLDFGEPWWEPHIRGFQILWPKRTEDVHSCPKENWTQDISGFDVLHNHSGILLGWVGSHGAEIVERMPKDEVGRQCVLLLRKFTLKQDIPFPKRVIRSKWFSNPYVKGAYSHTTSLCDASGSSPSMLSGPVYSEISQPLTNNIIKYHHPTILFAGEATHKCYFSTTHGAYETGKNQAMAVLESSRESPFQGQLHASMVLNNAEESC